MNGVRGDLLAEVLDHRAAGRIERLLIDLDLDEPPGEVASGARILGSGTIPAPSSVPPASEGYGDRWDRADAIVRVSDSATIFGA